MGKKKSKKVTKTSLNNKIAALKETIEKKQIDLTKAEEDLSNAEEQRSSINEAMKDQNATETTKEARKSELDQTILRHRAIIDLHKEKLNPQIPIAPGGPGFIHKEELDTAKQAIQAAQTALIKAEAKRLELTTELSSLRKEKGKKEKSIRSLDAKIQSIHDNLSTLRTDLTNAKEELASKEASLDTLLQDKEKRAEEVARKAAKLKAKNAAREAAAREAFKEEEEEEKGGETGPLGALPPSSRMHSTDRTQASNELPKWFTTNEEVSSVNMTAMRSLATILSINYSRTSAAQAYSMDKYLDQSSIISERINNKHHLLPTEDIQKDFIQNFEQLKGIMDVLNINFDQFLQEVHKKLPPQKGVTLESLKKVLGMDETKGQGR